MELSIARNKEESGKTAARVGASYIKEALKNKDEIRIILATGASQFAMIEALVQDEDIDWSRVEAFHLDEYIGIDDTHPASFRKYLKERFAMKVKGLKAFHYIDGGAADLEKEMERLNSLISEKEVDVAFVGIGENAHLAFNDPPADFSVETPYIIVNLDEDCRKQQMGEGWFSTLDEVPAQAVSMSVKQIMKSRVIINTVPDARKADAVKKSLECEISPEVPASILRDHPNTHTFLDMDAASLLDMSSVKL